MDPNHLERFRADYAGVKSLGLATDIQGWHYDEPIFDRLVRGLKSPAVYIEVGCYKGASIIRVAQLAKQLGLDLQCFAVDFWRESNQYEQFLHNVLVSGVADLIVPVRHDSVLGARLLQGLGIMADLIYIDAGHEFTTCYCDLVSYWPLLKPGGIMFGDDFTEEPGVKQAIEAFRLPFKHTYYHWELEPKT